MAQPGLERHVRDVKVGGSNPLTPTIFFVLSRPVIYGWIFFALILPKEPQAFTAQFPRNREQIENAKFSEKACILNKVAANSLFGKVGGRL